MAPEGRGAGSGIFRNMPTRGEITDRGRRRTAAASTLTSLRRIIHAIQAQSSRIEAAVGLTGPQFWALREINGAVGGLPIGRVAQRLVVHKASAGRMVDMLVKLGHVQCERPANDRRVVLARVTEKGRRLAETTQGPAQADMLSRLERMPVDEIEQIDRTLARLVALLGAEAVEAEPLFDGEKGERRKRRPPRPRSS
jgi:DNA-binding MarR family transcriptional regulator